ncbi:MAG: hypothetical protein JWQ30_2394 [Sediminibacterium sp.]|nr:hypothetical protein [Sediminibacterium sp.]
MWLQMIIGKMVIDQCAIEYDGLLTCTERQQYQERAAVEMKNKNIRQVKLAMKEPEFYVIGQASRINSMEEVSHGRGMTDDQFIRELKKEAAGESWAHK